MYWLTGLEPGPGKLSEHSVVSTLGEQGKNGFTVVSVEGGLL